MILNWNNIRPLNGGQDKAFEELCAQLARTEIPDGSRFKRKGTPDAGVECYAVLKDGAEWGWQAKYFNTLGNSQWSQLDKSVKTSLEKHPQLKRYYICVPIDRPDARISRQKSALEKWDDHVKKWMKWASDTDIHIEFIYWGSSELLEILSRPEHIGRTQFWFDTRGFDAAWFTTKLNEAIHTAGPRYTPEIHIDLPIAWEFEIIGRTARFFDREKGRAKDIRKKMRWLNYPNKLSEANIDSKISSITADVQKNLDALSTIETQPTGQLPFKAISEEISKIETTIEELLQQITEYEKKLEAKPGQTDKKTHRSSYQDNPIRNLENHLYDLSQELRDARRSFSYIDQVTNSSVLIVQGAAGTGKTHLLCDVAQQRNATKAPTVLLMGQRFVSNDAPWSQILQQLDLSDLSTEKFIGALEAAAQATGTRALIMIDAINEGSGRIIWPSHLAAFLASLEKSHWISVILSVRSSYEKIIVPSDVHESAVLITHQGFREYEYNAAKTFFAYYGLEFPSTPLFTPEFQNPLFLKTLCQGLQAKGKRRLPRGFSGITAIFNLYITAINERLASSLDFNPKEPLVWEALEAVVKAIFDSGKYSLTIKDATEIVDSFLPGRDFKSSLYYGLIVEGLLIEDVAIQRGEDTREIIFVSYERFGDHLIVKALLDEFLKNDDPSSIFADEGPLAFVYSKEKYISPGFLEALCIQLPERTGQELLSVAPACVELWSFADAFRQSIIWRINTAFSEYTHKILNELIRSDIDLHATLDALLTVSTIPGHPFNALFLDQRLRKDTMPDRDSWWSLYLHHRWGIQSVVDRLIDWASQQASSSSLDDDVVLLCAITLSWMFTSSNRFLRDRATKALVNLLTGRLTTTIQLVERFADTDDPYVIERVYAVAYGVAMRCHDPVIVGSLATSVYKKVFASETPHPHILLRDYARGTIERALHLGSKIDIDSDLIRPPYKSTWPNILTEDDIKPLLPDWSKGAHDSGELEWARNRIGSSVMSDDFARYVIGTNFSSTSSNWLSQSLDQEPWKPPISPENRLQSLIEELSGGERRAWDEFNLANKEYIATLKPLISDWTTQHEEGQIKQKHDTPNIEIIIDEIEKAENPEVKRLQEKREQSLTILEAELTEEHAHNLNEIYSKMGQVNKVSEPPRLDLGQIQRYVLWRVFDLGWTIERFGYFDRYHIGYHGRDAAKAERIGKKYQWIAYHEIIAYISDHFQYRERYREQEGDQAYEGTWQDGFRDIDPSCTVRSTPGGTSWESHTRAWWGNSQFVSWGKPDQPGVWALDDNDLPNVQDLIIATSPNDGLRWVNVQGHFNWRQRTPVDQESTDVERRELWYSTTGYLIKTDDVTPFIKWAESVDFWGRWMPDATEVHDLFLGEHTWAPASRYFEQEYYGNERWIYPGRECPVQIRTMALEYTSDVSSFDCSINENYRLRLPVRELVTGLNIQWSGHGADFVDATGQIISQDPTVHTDGPNALLLQADAIQEFLAREKLTIFWTIIGEKKVLSPGLGGGPYYPSLRLSGVYVLTDKYTTGFMKHMFDTPGIEGTENHQTTRIIRSGP
jgi:hypothetical protein